MLGILKPVFQVEFFALRRVAGEEQFHTAVVGDDRRDLIKQLGDALNLQPIKRIQLHIDQVWQTENFRNAGIQLLTLDRRHAFTPMRVKSLNSSRKGIIKRGNCVVLKAFCPRCATSKLPHRGCTPSNDP